MSAFCYYNYVMCLYYQVGIDLIIKLLWLAEISMSVR